MNKTGRPEKEIDFDTVDKLCALQCTGEEIASFLGIDYDTLNKIIKKEYKMSFSEYFQQKRNRGKVSLRRMQWATAESGNVTMQIWLGKNLLNQTDRQEVMHSGDLDIKVGFSDD